MQVAFFPNHWRGNPYLGLLEAALAEKGIEVHPDRTVDRPFIWWLKKHRTRIRVLHFHWLHYIYQRESLSNSLIQLIKFVVQLTYAKWLGYRIVWTMHNLYPHTRPYPALDRWARKIILRYSDAVLVHCEHARDLLAENFGRSERVYLAPHGHFVGSYPCEVTREDARNHLGLADDRLVYLYLGQIRPYKGLERMVDAFHEIADPDSFLIIAGSLDPGASLDESLAQPGERVLLKVGWIPGDEMQYYFRAADVVVCPFENILTSGSVILAMSFGRPVIAPRMGCLPELVLPDAGILYDPGRADGLTDAMRRCSRLNLDAMGRRASQVVESFSWSNMAEVTSAAY